MSPQRKQVSWIVDLAICIGVVLLAAIMLGGAWFHFREWVRGYL